MTWDPARLPDQTGRTIVVTGATAGIGYFAAEQLAASGADVVLASRSRTKLGLAEASIRRHVPGAAVRSVVIDLASLDSVSRASEELRALPRIDGVLLNGAAMSSRRDATTADGLPLLLGTHVIANARLLAGILPTLIETGRHHGAPTRVVHTSTGFVSQFRFDVGDIRDTPASWTGAYTHAKTVTEVFAFELDRRLRASSLPVASIVVRPGVGVDAKTPERSGIRDSSTPYQRNPFTPWAQGKDTAAWSAVRALTDPSAEGGQYYAPAGRFRGLPVQVEPLARTHTPPAETARAVWDQIEELAGIRLATLVSP